MIPYRKPIESETDAQIYTRQAMEVLQKQHDRIVLSIDTLLQYFSWMPADRLTESEKEILAAAQQFVDSCNKKKRA